jgi:hypothetical protein
LDGGIDALDDIMKIKTLIFAGFFGVMFARQCEAQSQTDALSPPGFHHLHLNSVNPDAAIGFYVRQFPSTTEARLGFEDGAARSSIFNCLSPLSAHRRYAQRAPLLAPLT